MSTTLRLFPPFRADHIGSLKRPAKLLEKRDAFDKKQISAEELREVEDEAIKAIVEMQRSVGIKSITDGEFRRCRLCSQVHSVLRVSTEGFAITQTHVLRWRV